MTALTVAEQIALIEHLQARYPDYDVRIVPHPEFTRGEAQIRHRKAHKAGSKYINPGWLSAGWVDDLMRRYNIREAE